MANLRRYRHKDGFKPLPDGSVVDYVEVDFDKETATATRTDGRKDELTQCDAVIRAVNQFVDEGTWVEIKQETK